MTTQSNGIEQKVVVIDDYSPVTGSTGNNDYYVNDFANAK